MNTLGLFIIIIVSKTRASRHIPKFPGDACPQDLGSGGLGTCITRKVWNFILSKSASCLYYYGFEAY